MQKFFFFTLFVSLLFIPFTNYSAPSDSLKIDSLPLVLDDPSHISAMDSMWVEEQLRSQQIITDTSILNIRGYASDSLPLFSDSILQERLSVLNAQTPLNYALTRQ